MSKLYELFECLKEPLEEFAWGEVGRTVKKLNALPRKFAYLASELPDELLKTDRASKEAQPHPEAYKGPQRTSEPRVADLIGRASRLLFDGHQRAYDGLVMLRFIANKKLDRAEAMAKKWRV
jgi:hypothetical protein